MPGTVGFKKNVSQCDNVMALVTQIIVVRLYGKEIIINFVI